MGDNKTTTNSLSRREITILCLCKTFHSPPTIQIQFDFAQMIPFDPLVDSQHITEFNSLQIGLGDNSLVSRVKQQITLQQWSSAAHSSRE